MGGSPIRIFAYGNVMLKLLLAPPLDLRVRRPGPIIMKYHKNHVLLSDLLL